MQWPTPAAGTIEAKRGGGFGLRSFPEPAKPNPHLQQRMKDEPDAIGMQRELEIAGLSVPGPASAQVPAITRTAVGPSPCWPRTAIPFNEEPIVSHISRRQRYDELDDEAKRAGRRPAAPRFRATVKWYRDDLGFGFATSDNGDLFLSKQVVGEGIDLPAGTTLTVRGGIDPEAGKPAVLELLDIDRSTAVMSAPALKLVAPKRVETGRLIGRTASGSGFLAPDLGGDNIYIPAACLLRLECKVGDRLECKVGDGNKGPIATKIIKKVL
jgi:cold shock CspA family protein